MIKQNLAVNHIIECDQQTGVILRKCENDSYYVEFVSGDKKCIPASKITFIPLSKQLLSIIGFSFKGSSVEYSCLEPLDRTPIYDKEYCMIEVSGHTFCFQAGKIGQNSCSISTLDDLQDYFIRMKIPYDFSNRQLLVRIATMNMLTYNRKNPIGVLTC